MSMQFRNRQDSRGYAAAEDAFTSEGGYLPPEDGASGKDIAAGRENRQPSRDFRETMHRYVTGMRAVLTVFRGGSAHPTTRNANPPAR